MVAMPLAFPVAWRMMGLRQRSALHFHQLSRPHAFSTFPPVKANIRHCQIFSQWLISPMTIPAKVSMFLLLTFP
jgi:hypothetical protein